VGPAEQDRRAAGAARGRLSRSRGRAAAGVEPRSGSSRAGIGDIRLDGLTGPVYVHTGIGQIQASAVSGPLIRLYAGTGMISVGCTAPPRVLVASTGVGAVTIRVPVTVAYRVTANTQVGSVRVTVPQATTSGHEIHASTGPGTVTVTGN
jgi:hypothetical protein